MKRKLLISLFSALFIALMLTLTVGAACSEHTNSWTVELGENGFLGEMTATGTCSACGEKTTDKIPALFITKGYSYSENGGIAQGYGVNRDAIAKYEKYTGETVKFGAVVALRDTIGENEPLDDSLNPVSSKVKTADFTDTDYSIINVCVDKIPSSSFGAKLLCALYVNAGGETTYLDNRAQKKSCGEKTFTEVVLSPTPDTPTIEKYTVINKNRYHQMTMEELNLTQGYFWNDSSIQNNTTNQAFNNKFWTTGYSYTKDDLPVGTIITIDSDNGWQYRPHKWSGSRPNNTKEKAVVIDETWWGSYTYVGFNIGKYDGTGATQDSNSQSDISGYTAEQIASIFKIFIPLKPVTSGGGSTDDEVSEEDTIKILCIGNSFSVDSMEYVYQVAMSAGAKKVVLGNLYIGGCSLDTHYNNALNSSNSYTYYTNTSGTWSSTAGKSIQYALASDNWDFVSIQQVSGYSGVADSYSNLQNLINIVKPLAGDAKLVWHMTWAYQTGSGHSDFGKYENNQITMYNAIVDTVQEKIVTNSDIDIIIPAGTAIQNARTSYVGDTLTRDGYHLNDYGRFIGSLTFVKALTGLSIDNVTYAPDGVDADELKVAIESVNNAVAKPFEVTQSAYPADDSGDSGDTGDSGDSGSTGVIIDYKVLTYLEMGIQKNSFYNSSGAETVNGTDDFSKGYARTKKFTKDELPVGTIIEIADGWQYRPEGWAYTGSRPDNVTTSKIVVDEAWWGTYTQRAFNISMVGHTQQNPLIIELTEEELASILKITVPVFEGEEEEVTPEDVTISSSDCDETVVTIDGIQYRALTIDAMGLTKSAYYFSKSHVKIFDTSNSNLAKRYFATKVFEKGTLPDGTVLWVNSGWQYRPEGWIGDTTTPESNRPGNTSATYTTVNDTWWGDWTARAFNVSKTDSSNIDGLTNEEVYENFKIYIPVDEIVEG